LLIAHDSIEMKPLAGAVVKSESEEDVAYFSQALKEWLPYQVKNITLDFSKRIEAGVKVVFPDVEIQKCVFHATHLLNRGLLKELTRIKNEKFQAYINELKLIRTNSLKMEEGKKLEKLHQLNFEDVKNAWQVYTKLRAVFSSKNFQKVEIDFERFIKSTLLKKWKGAELFTEKYNKILSKSNWSQKGIKYIREKVYKAWRAVIRKFRKEIEEVKKEFNEIKYLILMNPINMKPFHKRKMRELLAKFPWLRSYRKIITRFYYQFRLSPEKRRSLKFLLKLVLENSHSRLKSAVNTLIENEKQIFRFQVIYKENPQLRENKALKVVWESGMRKINKLYQAQYGLRTLENIQMRISNYLKCPIIVAPNALEEF